jgi:hypothetical protein
MSSKPVRWIVAALAGAGLAAAAVAVAGSSPSPPQALFKRMLLADRKIDPSVADSLRTGASFVSPDPVFADLTGDGKSDAVVTVDDGGVARAIAVYALTADGSKHGRLRVALRAEHLYQARVRTSGATITVITSQFASGDDVCCPRGLIERDYAWSARRDAFARQASRRLPGS